MKKRKLAAAILALCLIPSLFAGCQGGDGGKDGQESTHVVVDSVGREVELPNPVSEAVLANNYTASFVRAIGAQDAVVGIDEMTFNDKDMWGDFPEDKLIGKGQKELNYEKIIELNPQVLIMPSNGTLTEAEEKLEPFGIKVFALDTYYTDQFSDNCDRIGAVFGKEKEAEELKHFFLDKVEYINKQLEGVEKKRVYFEDGSDFVTTVPGSFFFNMVEYAHADNVFKEATGTKIESEAVINANPDYIYKISSKFGGVSTKYTPPTQEQYQQALADIKGRAGWDEINAVKNDNILLLTNYAHSGGSKLIATFYLAKFLYPEQLPELHPEDILKEWFEKYQGLEYIPGHSYPSYELGQ